MREGETGVEGEAGGLEEGVGDGEGEIVGVEAGEEREGASMEEESGLVEVASLQNTARGKRTALKSTTSPAWATVATVQKQAPQYC